MPATAKKASKILLIVEDDILPAMALRDELEEAGYNVLDLTGHPGEALVAARSYRPDLALVNIDLQGVPAGIELAFDLKALGIPSLFISGQVNRARTARTTAIASLPKPYSTFDAVRAVGYLLGCLRGDLSMPPGLEIFGTASTMAQLRNDSWPFDSLGPFQVDDKVPIS